ncbi:MAG: LVIVD repeat-containing protein [Clostridia bacterium]
MKNNNRVLNILIVSLIIILACVFAFEYYQSVQRERLMELSEQEESKRRTATDENSINIVTDIDFGDVDEGAILLSYDSFLKTYSRTSHYIGETSATYKFSRTLVSGNNDIYLLNFKMRADTQAAVVNVKFGIEHNYYITTQWRNYYMYCTKGEIDIIKWKLLTPFQKIYLSDVHVVRYDPLAVDLSKMKNGSYSVEKVTEYSFSEFDGIGVGKTMDVAGDGEYLYSAGDELLKISRIKPDGTELVSTLEGIGNIRHIEQRDTNILALASRETGVYLVNIQDKTNPYIESYYDPFEIANDVCFSGNYMFVAGRYFGVEIVDISDTEKPRYITRIVNNKECYRCIVGGNYLFVSCWATHEVEIYDISLIDSPILVNSITVDGRCAEAFVENSVLYVVSGYNSPDNADKVGDPGYGTGNGLTIYDISDIKRPVWCSTIKTEGNLYGNGYDDWSVKVSDGYVYFTNSFGGMYIYDVNNIKAPLLISHIAVEIHSDSTNFVDFTKNSINVYPYDTSKSIYSPAMGIYVDNGSIFIACAYNDVYRYTFEKAKVIENRAETSQLLRGSDKDSSYSQDYNVFFENYDIYAIVKYSDFYIAATGEGVLLLGPDFSIVNQYKTDDPVKDVKVTQDGYAVTAEKYGVAVYEIKNNTLSRISFVKSNTNNTNVSSVGLTGDGKYAIVQSSWTKFEAIDLHNKYNPVLVKDVVSKNGAVISIDSIQITGNMYYRNIVSGTVDGTVGIGGGKSTLWFESLGDRLKVKNTYSNKFASEVNGSAVVKEGQEVLSIYNNGYVVYNPLTVNETPPNKEKFYVNKVRLKGKVSINNDILVICNEPSGIIHVVNIADIESPYLEAYYELEESPGIALIEDDFILVPVRHGGIIKIIL